MEIGYRLARGLGASSPFIYMHEGVLAADDEIYVRHMWGDEDQPAGLAFAWQVKMKRSRARVLLELLKISHESDYGRGDGEDDVKGWEKLTAN